MINQVMGKDIIVTLELPDGSAWQGKALMCSINMDCPIHKFYGIEDNQYQLAKTGPCNYTMELQVVGEPNLIPRQEFTKQIRTNQLLNEWKCQYCGAVMSKTDKKCCGCGAWRSVLYDI